MRVIVRRSMLQLLVLMLACALPAASQTGGPPSRDSLAGLVKDERGRPIEGARVAIVGSPAAAVTTDARGRFRVLNAGPGEVSVKVTAIGFAPLTRAVRTGATPVELSLTELLVKLDAMVVTGTAGAVENRAVGNSVTKIDVASTLEVAPVTDVAQLLNGRASGVELTANSGMAGAGVKISIRGRNSLALTSQPLVYVDGVRIDASPSTGPSLPAVQGASIISRLNDISPSDIESIEIIKGPAAATLYGTEASNGVIQIITKVGRVGDKPRIDVSVEQGTNSFQNPGGRIPTNYSRNSAGQVIAFNAAQSEDARGTPIWRTGYFQRYDLAASGGAGTITYRVGGNVLNDQGVDRTNSQRLLSGRANLQFLPRPSFSARLDLGLVNGETRLTPQEGASGAIFGAIQANPLLKDTPSRGFQFGGPPDVLGAVNNVFQLLRRTTAGVQLQHQIGQRFTQRLNAGVDYAQENNQNIVKRMTPAQAQFYSPLAAQGRKDVQLRDAVTNTVDYSGSYTFPLSSSLTSNTAVGAQYYDRFARFTNATGTQFAAPGLETILGTAVKTGSDDYVENATVGTYVQEQFAWRNRLFLTGAVRVDNNSAFGTNYKLATYPKVSASWVVNEEPFWKVGFVNTLKLRGAFGVAGQQPDAFAALRTLAPTTGPGDQPALTTQAVGNSNLKPERSSELELGFDASFFQQRLGLEFTYYHQDRRDAILQAPVPPSSGFIGTQLINAGQIRNDGAELKATFAAVNAARFGWDLGASLSTNTNKITSLGGQPSIIVGTFPRAQQQRVGYPVAAFFAQRIVSATLDANGVATNLMCDGGPGAAGAVPCATAPLVYLGRSTPKYEGAVTSTIRLLEHVRLYTMVDFKTGHKRFNTNDWARCTVFRFCLESYSPEKFSPIRDAYVQRGSGLLLVDGFINNASFAKLREISVNVDIPASWVRAARASGASITLSGRNLHTWTSWTGLDPELEQPTSSFGNELVSSEQSILPQPRQFRFKLNLTY